MSTDELSIQSREFAKHIVLTCRWMKGKGVEYALIDQLLRSGTSIGANIHEAKHAQSTKDFISKYEIALKECNECLYWIDLLYRTASIKKQTYSALMTECVSIQRMLAASVVKLKAN